MKIKMNTCKTCRWWGEEDDLVNGCAGVRACRKDGAIYEPTAGGHRYGAKAFVTQHFDLHDDDFDPRFLTGPDFGCVHHEPSSAPELVFSESSIRALSMPMTADQQADCLLRENFVAKQLVRELKSEAFACDHCGLPATVVSAEQGGFVKCACEQHRHLMHV